MWFADKSHLLRNNDQESGQIFRIQDEMLLLDQISQVASQQTAAVSTKKQKQHKIKVVFQLQYHQTKSNGFCWLSGMANERASMSQIQFKLQ